MTTALQRKREQLKDRLEGAKQILVHTEDGDPRRPRRGANGVPRRPSSTQWMASTRR